MAMATVTSSPRWIRVIVCSENSWMRFTQEISQTDSFRDEFHNPREHNCRCVSCNSMVRGKIGLARIGSIGKSRLF
jgi:hypothetical protein